MAGSDKGFSKIIKSLGSERRSRLGCKPCRSIHLKCDEVSPECGRCQARGLVCEYNDRIKWEGVVTLQTASRSRPPGSSTRSKRTIPKMSPLGLSARNWGLTTSVFEKPEEITAYKYYVDRLAGELQAQDGLDNPYRRLSSMALSFPVLLRTIIACAAEHMHICGHFPIQQAIEQCGGAIRLLRSNILDWKPSSGHNSSSEGGDTADHALLAAILLQPAVIAFGGGSASSAETYLDIALYGLNELKYLGTTDLRSAFFPRLLVQRFAMVDIALSVYGRRRPRIPLQSWFAQPSNENALDKSQPSFRKMTGCAHTVFVFFLRVMHLAADFVAPVRPSKDMFNEAIQLEAEARVYDMQYFKPFAADDDGNKGISPEPVARAFLHAAILLLLRRVFSEPYGAPRVQHAVSTVFSLMDTILTTGAGEESKVDTPLSGLDSASGLPFYIAAREAASPEDQDWVRQKHAAWRKVYPNPARVRLMEVAEKIWAERAKGMSSVLEQTCESIERSCEAYIF